MKHLLLVMIAIQMGLSKKGFVMEEELIAETITKKNGDVVRRYKLGQVVENKTEEEVLNSIQCFEQECAWDDDWTGKYRRKVKKVIKAGIEENVVYSEYFKGDKKNSVKFRWWREGTKVFGQVLEWNKKKKEYVLQRRLVWDLEGKKKCFKTIPNDCKFAQHVTEYFQDFCAGFEKLPEKLHEDVIKVTVNSGDMNPTEFTHDIAKCIKRKMSTFSVQLECAIDGLPMERKWAEQQYNKIYSEIKDMYPEVDYDPIKLTMNYSNETLEGVKIVRETEDDWEVDTPSLD